MCKADSKGKEVDDSSRGTNSVNKDGSYCLGHLVDDSSAAHHGEWSIVKSRRGRRTSKK